MKKLLTILLALLVVTGVVFAVAPGNASLTLSSTVTGFTKHGFFENKASEIYETYDEDVDGWLAYDSATSDSLSVTLNKTGEELGYYNFWTNSQSNFTVSFKLDSLKEATLNWWVPYKLNFETIEDEGNRLDGGDVIVSSLGAKDPGFENATDTKIVAATPVLKTTGSGNGYISIGLTADFDADNLENIPAGTYTGTITASVTSP